MKQIFRFLFAATTMVAISISIEAQTSATANGTAGAVIIAPITLTAGTNLHFGVAYNTGGTVIISTAGVRTGTCAVSAALPAHAAGTFTVTGERAQTYTTTVPADGTVTISNGAVTMAVNGFNHNATGTIPGVAPGTGSETFSVGATLTVGVGQASGTYTGTYPVTVQYN